MYDIACAQCVNSVLYRQVHIIAAYMYVLVYVLYVYSGRHIYEGSLFRSYTHFSHVMMYRQKID